VGRSGRFVGAPSSAPRTERRQRRILPFCSALASEAFQPVNLTAELSQTQHVLHIDPEVAAALGKLAADWERHDEQGKDHGCQSDGAVGENACCRIGDTGRKDTACQFGYSICRYPGGVALVLADQSI